VIADGNERSVSPDSAGNKANTVWSRVLKYKSDISLSVAAAYHSYRVLLLLTAPIAHLLH
jgi:hypothetical protein